MHLGHLLPAGFHLRDQTLFSLCILLLCTFSLPLLERLWNFILFSRVHVHVPLPWYHYTTACQVVYFASICINACMHGIVRKVMVYWLLRSQTFNYCRSLRTTTGKAIAVANMFFKIIAYCLCNQVGIHYYICVQSTNQNPPIDYVSLIK